MKAGTIFGAILALTLMGTSCARTLNEADTVVAADTDSTIDGRIVGGRTVDISAHPHQVSMRLKSILSSSASYSHNCGGSIISESIVLTAAHCVIAKVPSQYQIVAGTNQRRSADGAIATVKEIIIHEQYSPSTYSNDVAIMVLGTPLPINNFTIKAVPLAEEGSLNGATATVSGWGTLSSGGTSPTMLQEVKVPIVSNEICNADYSGLITDSMLCAGVRGTGGKDACQGDSGGPLLVNNKLAGIVSWGYGCAQANYPGVYANVSYLLPWILEKIAEVELTLLSQN
ncbi:trypsin zeta-like [Anastrepha obliqua]|uniref:trypsin zeta-like n=1 Tax=Anastrepha obliqua TaxID=95512 RepID=UPI00240952CD|nr:trypsin zeta-like [Anastrepha obliqua]